MNLYARGRKDDLWNGKGEICAEEKTQSETKQTPSQIQQKGLASDWIGRIPIQPFASMLCATMLSWE